MRHAKRTVLTADDVDSALGLRNVEVNYLSYAKISGYLQCMFVGPLCTCESVANKFRILFSSYCFSESCSELPKRVTTINF
jgi:hypothetical protein